MSPLSSLMLKRLPKERIIGMLMGVLFNCHSGIKIRRMGLLVSPDEWLSQALQKPKLSIVAQMPTRRVTEMDGRGMLLLLKL